MTTNDDGDGVFAESGLTLVEAFLDGEPVDPEALQAALEQPAVREHLAAVLRLRQAMAVATPRTWSLVGRPAPRGRKAATWLAAAAGVVLSVATGYVAGQRATEPSVDHATVEAVVNAATPAAPEPTSVIRLQPGVNWTETTGGR